MRACGPRSKGRRLSERPKAFTFDFGNTLAAETFEPARVREARLGHIAEWLTGLGAANAPDEVAAAFDATEALAHEAARREHTQIDVGGSVQQMLAHLGAEADDVAQAALQEFLEDSLPEPGFAPVDGVFELLDRLRSDGYGLGIVSNLWWSSGKTIRRHLAPYGLLEYFAPDAVAFSDEIGVLKPHPAIFEHALRGLGSMPEETVHVGDLRLTDVAGARALGMRSVRYIGVHDDASDGPEADVVVSDYRDFLAALGL